jgi:hypothetical protein
MKSLIYKKIALVTFMLVTISVTHASDLISHTVILLPDDPQNEETWTQTINNQEDWETFFYARTSRVQYEQSQAPIAPEFDFEKYQVLAGGLGVKPSSGYTLSVESVSELENTIDVHVINIEPGSDCFRFLQQLTYPSVTVLIKKTNKPFRFFVTHLINEECS